jgi:quinone-reactive Ni/Fe-hydrogenase small subunit/[NiFe] hydrogenase small subunit
MRLGPKAETGIEIGKRVTSKAAATIAIGACAVSGGIPAARPNPTDAVGVGKALGISTVNLAGCPPNTVNFTGTLLYFLLFGALPALDSQGRPVWAYGKRIHDFCERRAHYDAGEFVDQWGDEGARKGWCLYKVGCKGPYAFANCSHLRFNDGISWPVMAGHGCIGCTEIGFWDTMAPLEKPIQAATIGGGERTVDDIGIMLTAVTVAGVAAHGLFSALRHGGSDKKDETPHNE